MLILILLFSSFSQCDGTTLGVDVSQLFDKPSAWNCLRKNANRTWGIVRAYHSYGAFDENSIATLGAAKTGGMTNMDVYLCPCPTKSASSQASEMIQSLKDSSWNSVWIDIETNPSTGCGWSTTNVSSNCKFLEELINSLTSTGAAVGIYSSHYEWEAVMGSGTKCTVGNHLPLWYARYNYGPTCQDYSNLPFGGWEKPFAKQYSDKGDRNADTCGFQSADMNVRCSS
jgi:hypothetical protein